MCRFRPCPLLLIRPFTIATSTRFQPMVYLGLWEQPLDTDRTIPDGDYTINACTTGGSVCAQSGLFTIISTTSSSSLPSLKAISPANGPAGTEIFLTTILSGIDHINFGNAYIPKNQITIITSGANTNMSFYVPNQINPACYYSTPRCYLAAVMTPPGLYNISVTDTNGATTNSVPFTVTQ
jgi:hypothetical protein